MHLFPELLDDLRKIDRLSVAVGDDLNRPRTSGIPDLRRSAALPNLRPIPKPHFAVARSPATTLKSLSRRKKSSKRVRNTGCRLNAQDWMSLDTKLPKRLHRDAKSALHEIWQADSREAAEKAFDRFVATYEAKYPKAVGCLAKDRAELLAFYDFPAAHWQHLRTTNPIESTFATIRLRTKKTRNCVSAKSGLSLVHQLAMSAQKRWRRLRGFRQLADVIAGVKFIDGIDERKISRKAA
jgi:hypothetical protein